MKQVLIISRLPYRRMNGVARYLMCITSHSDPAAHGIDLRVCEWGREHNARRWHDSFFPNKVQRKLRRHDFHNHYVMPWTVRRSSAELIHVTFNGLPEKWHVGDVPYVLTLHGTAPFHAHEWGVDSQRGEYTRDRLLAGHSKIHRIITCSEWSKSELLANYGLSEDLIVVQHHGVDIQKFRVLPDREQIQSSLRQQFGLDTPYLLNVGATAPRKNIPGLIKGFAAFKTRHRTAHKLVLVGAPGAQQEMVEEEIGRHGLQDDVIFTRTITDETLIKLYNGATAMVFPSFYEGFGYPIIEAMACGVPVITSNITSMPEVAGNAADYIGDPYDLEQITSAIERVILDNDYQTQLREAGLKRVQQFSWQTSAENHLKLYQQLL